MNLFFLFLLPVVQALVKLNTDSQFYVVKSGTPNSFADNIYIFSHTECRDRAYMIDYAIMQNISDSAKASGCIIDNTLEVPRIYWNNDINTIACDTDNACVVAPAIDRRTFTLGMKEEKNVSDIRATDALTTKFGKTLETNPVILKGTDNRPQESQYTCMLESVCPSSSNECGCLKGTSAYVEQNNNLVQSCLSDSNPRQTNFVALPDTETYAAPNDPGWQENANFDWTTHVYGWNVCSDVNDCKDKCVATGGCGGIMKYSLDIDEFIDGYRFDIVSSDYPSGATTATYALQPDSDFYVTQAECEAFANPLRWNGAADLGTGYPHGCIIHTWHGVSFNTGDPPGKKCVTNESPYYRCVQKTTTTIERWRYGGEDSNNILPYYAKHLTSDFTGLERPVGSYEDCQQIAAYEGCDITTDCWRGRMGTGWLTTNYAFGHTNNNYAIYQTRNIVSVNGDTTMDYGTQLELTYSMCMSALNSHHGNYNSWNKINGHYGTDYYGSDKPKCYSAQYEQIRCCYGCSGGSTWECDHSQKKYWIYNTSPFAGNTCIPHAYQNVLGSWEITDETTNDVKCVKLDLFQPPSGCSFNSDTRTLDGGTITNYGWWYKDQKIREWDDINRIEYQNGFSDYWTAYIMPWIWDGNHATVFDGFTIEKSFTKVITEQAARTQDSLDRSLNYYDCQTAAFEHGSSSDALASGPYRIASIPFYDETATETTLTRGAPETAFTSLVGVYADPRWPSGCFSAKHSSGQSIIVYNDYVPPSGTGIPCGARWATTWTTNSLTPNIGSGTDTNIQSTTCLLYPKVGCYIQQSAGASYFQKDFDQLMTTSDDIAFVKNTNRVSRLQPFPKNQEDALRFCLDLCDRTPDCFYANIGDDRACEMYRKCESSSASSKALYRKLPFFLDLNSTLQEQSSSYYYDIGVLDNTCTMIEDRPECYVDYCNRHLDLKNNICGGAPCGAEHIAACKEHWNTTGINDGSRTFTPEVECIQDISLAKTSLDANCPEFCVATEGCTIAYMNLQFCYALPHCNMAVGEMGHRITKIVRDQRYHELFPYNAFWPCDALVMSDTTIDACIEEASRENKFIFSFNNATGSCLIYEHYKEDAYDELMDHGINASWCYANNELQEVITSLGSCTAPVSSHVVASSEACSFDTYYEQPSGAPDLSVPREECMAIAGGETNTNWGGDATAVSYPAGCVKTTSGYYYFGLDTCVEDCGVYSIKCIQKVEASSSDCIYPAHGLDAQAAIQLSTQTLSYLNMVDALDACFETSDCNYVLHYTSSDQYVLALDVTPTFIEVSDGVPVGLVEKDHGAAAVKGSPEYVTASECPTDQPHPSTNDRPSGCYKRGGVIYFNTLTSSTEQCSASDLCIQKDPAYVTLEECEAYAESQNFLWNPNNNEGGRPKGCWRQLGASSKVHWNSGGGEGCSKGPCIQKATAFIGEYVQVDRTCNLKPQQCIDLEQTHVELKEEGFADMSIDCADAANSLGRSGVKYYEQSSGTPDLSVSIEECEQYANANDYTWAVDDAMSNSRPTGCLLTNAEHVRYNPDVNDIGDCGVDNYNCIQKQTQLLIANAAKGCILEGSSILENKGLGDTFAQTVAFSECTPENECYKGKLEMRYVPDEYEEVSSGAPDLSVSQEECQAYATFFGNEYAVDLDGWIGLTVGEYAASPQGCYRAGHFPYVSMYYNTGGVVSCLGTTIWCIQKKKKFIKVGPFVEVSSGAPDLSVSLEQCETYAETNYPDYTWSPTTTSTGNPKGCFVQHQTEMVHWNINPDGGNVCGGAYNALCIQRKPLSLQQCMVAVHRAGYAAGHHSLAANVDGTGEWTAGSCWGKYEGVLDGPVFHEVSQGAPDLSVNLEECRAFGESLGKWDETVDVSVVSWNNDVPRGCYMCGSSDCTNEYSNLVQYNTAPSDTNANDCGKRLGDNCIQRVAYYVEREVASFNVRTMTNELGGYANMVYEKNTGAPDLSLSLEECKAYTIGTDGITYGGSMSNYGWPKGCIYASGSEIKFNEDTSSSVECGETSLNVYNPKCIQKHDHAHITDETFCRHIPSFDSVIFDIEESAGCILRDGKAYFNTYMANGPFYIHVNGGFEQVVSEAPDLSVSEEECLAYYMLPSTSSWDRGAGIVKGCQIYNGVVAFNINNAAENNVECGNGYYNCIQKADILRSSLGPATCTAAYPCVDYMPTLDNRTYSIDTSRGSVSCHLGQGKCRPAYYRATTDLPDLSMSPEECEDYGRSTEGLSWNGLMHDTVNRPSGCIQINAIQIWYNDPGGTKLCSTTNNAHVACIQKRSKQKQKSRVVAVEEPASLGEVTGLVRAKDCPEAYEWSEIDYIEVPNGAPATLGVVMPDGTPAVEGSPEWMSETECEQYKIDNGYSDFWPQTSTGRPEGCWLYISGTIAHIYWNHASYVATADMKCTANQPCIQKSLTAAAYVSASECEQYGESIGQWGGVVSITGEIKGCYYITDPNISPKVWYNTDSSSVAECNLGERTCIQQKIYDEDNYKTYMLGSIQYDVGADTCGTCFPGHYSTDHGCLPCPTGRYSSKQQILDQGFLQSCTICEQGRFQDETGQADCKACAQDSFQDLRGETSCQTEKLDADGNTIQGQPTGTGAWIGRSGPLQSQNRMDKATALEGATRWSDSCEANEIQLCKSDLSNPGVDSEGNVKLTDCNPQEGVCIACEAGKEKLNNFCVDCLAGTFKGDHDLACQDCLPGYYQNDVGTVGCKPCDAGKYQTSSASQGCLACGAGRYQDNQGQASCKDCDPGKSTQLGQTVSSGINGFSGSGLTDCVDCSVGLFQINSGSSFCQNCDAGKYSTAGSTTCTACDPGQYRPSSSSPDCVDADLGYYVVGSGNTAQTICPEGTYMNDFGSSDANCKYCGDGKYVATTPATGCTTCTAGKFASGQLARVECTACEAGKTSSLGASSCTECDEGYFSSDATGNLCQPCPQGKYQENAQSSSCIQCELGRKEVVGTGATSENDACPVCGAGKYQDQNGITTCKNCPGGRYLSDDQVAELHDEEDDCTRCAAGKKSSASGATSSSTCTACAAGSISAAGATACSDCGAGKFADNAISCTGCDAGKYQDENRKTGCKGCNRGEFQNLGGQSSCNNCAAGKESNSDYKECSYCPCGRYRHTSTEKNHCKNCPAGQFQDSTGATHCDDVNQYYTQPNSGSCHMGDQTPIRRKQPKWDEQCKCKTSNNGEYRHVQGPCGSSPLTEVYDWVPNCWTESCWACWCGGSCVRDVCDSYYRYAYYQATHCRL
ncbi:MAG: hypothetical protein CMH46_00340 [Muricauda sp.]|nr:hypothetical protein [Allomuricauda sp.]MAU13971.1 hypothetical protein [Allomuricauda sp.]